MMPVTAKLSRRVYEQLGDDVANAIVEWFNAMDATYRADLRELNDLNYARFDAKVGERFAQFEAKIGERFAQFEAKVGERFAQMEAKFERLDVRIDNCVDRATFEQRLSSLELRLTRKLYGVSTVALLAQTAILIGLLKFFAGH